MYGDRPSRSATGPRELPPHLKNALERDDEMMTIGPIAFVLGLSAVILVIVFFLIAY